ncbi:MAG: tRNA glutamyl-Q(34) synthetase GluQRS [Rhodothermales bacterium]
MIRGRWAPSPTGLLHVGSARTALTAWLSVRSQGGVFIWRTEDLDSDRVVRDAEHEAMEDLRWLGLDWDEGPDVDGPGGPFRQSQRIPVYDRALARLYESEFLFPCSLSRADVREAVSAPEGNGLAYPAHLRPSVVRPDWFENPLAEESVRFRVDPGLVTFEDRLFGQVSTDVSSETGDFVLKRKDGIYAYQLAVVVDDAAMGITEVVRGADLIDSTPRQILLYRALGEQPPAFGHIPIAVSPDGDKLSKRHNSLTIRSLRDSGVDPGDLCGYLAWTLGLIEQRRPIQPRELVAAFAWESLTRDRLIVPNSLVDILNGLQ